MAKIKPRVALLAGATGLVGQALLHQLLADPRYGRIKVLTRRPLTHDDGRIELILGELDKPGDYGAQLACDDVFCCLGTTLRKAGSRAAFERVDYHMVVELARAAKRAGAKRYIVVSAAGSAKRSPSFYSRVKGRMEESVAEIGFEAVHILRPSLLLGAREESRPLERLGQMLAPLLKPLMRGPLAKYQPIEASEVARAMIEVAQRQSGGVHIHELPLRAAK